MRRRDIGLGALAPAVSVVGGWLIATRFMVALGVAALLAALFVPASILIAGGVLMSGGAQQNPLAGPLIAADLLFIAWVVRSLAQHDAAPRQGLRRVALPLLLFLAWATVATYLNGVSATPLLRLGLYAAVMLCAARFGANQRLLYFAVMGFAIWNIIGGALQGQDRLVGLYIGDPAQMGALILAALIPLITGDLRFHGWWLTIPLLAYGGWLTQTRSVWFAAIVVIATWALQYQAARLRTLLILLGVTIAGFAFVGAVTEQLGLNPDSVSYRGFSIMNGIESGLARPWFGSGWANVETITVAGILPYNLFVNVFASVGAPGVMLLLMFLWALLGHLVREKRAPFYFAVAFLAMSLIEMTIYAGSLLTVLFFVYSGVGLHESGRIKENLATTDPSVAGQRT